MSKIKTQYTVSWQIPSSFVRDECETVERPFDSRKEAFAFARRIGKKDPKLGLMIHAQDYIPRQYGLKDFVGDSKVVIDCTHEDFKKLMRSK